jgi:transcriptional regulator with XRE-family HTH domain
VSDASGGNTQQQLAAELKRVREATGLSQEQMAARLGIDYAQAGRKVSTGRAAVSAWERGRRTPPAHYLQTYVNLGGNPSILTPQKLHDESAIENRTNGESASSDFAEKRGRLRLHGRYRLFVIAGTLIVIAAGATYGITASHERGTPKAAAKATTDSTWTETTGTPAHTWADATQLTGAGTPLGPRQSVQVSCRVRGYVVQDGDPWWYRLASAPWNGHYYATSDAFYNNGDTSGPVDTGVVVDEQVPLC